MERKNIALIYGGNSLEAEISIKSGKNVADNLDRDRYNIYEVLLRGESWRVINPNGEIVPGGFAEELLNGEIEIEKGYVNVDEASVNANNSGAHGRIKIEDMQKLPGTEIDKTDFSFTFGGVKTRFDYAFIMIHGNPGENGVLQG